MRRTTGLVLSASVLLGVLAGCGSDAPAGTLTQDQVKGAQGAEKRDGISNQVICQAIDDAEDRLVAVQPSTKDLERASVSFDLTGDSKDHEFVDSSVWPVSDPQREVDNISDGIDACITQYPGSYERIDSVKGFPKAVGYVQKGGTPPVFTRRILVPLEDRVVIVGVLLEGSDDFTVTPEDLLDDAVKAAADAKTS